MIIKNTQKAAQNISNIQQQSSQFQSFVQSLHRKQKESKEEDTRQGLFKGRQIDHEINPEDYSQPTPKSSVNEKSFCLNEGLSSFLEAQPLHQQSSSPYPSELSRCRQSQEPSALFKNSPIREKGKLSPARSMIHEQRTISHTLKKLGNSLIVSNQDTKKTGRPSLDKVIELPRGTSLPHWLFQHAKRTYSDALKNFKVRNNPGVEKVSQGTRNTQRRLNRPKKVELQSFIKGKNVNKEKQTCILQSSLNGQSKVNQRYFDHQIKNFQSSEAHPKSHRQSNKLNLKNHFLLNYPYIESQRPSEDIIEKKIKPLSQYFYRNRDSRENGAVKVHIQDMFKISRQTGNKIGPNSSLIQNQSRGIRQRTNSEENPLPKV